MPKATRRRPVQNTVHSRLFSSLCIYEACPRWRNSQGGSFLTSFYGNGGTKFSKLTAIELSQAVVQEGCDSRLR